MIKILNVACNDVRIRFSYRAHWIFLLVIPLIFTAILGVALDEFGDSNGSLPQVLVVDEDGSDLSETLLQALDRSGAVQPLLVSKDAAERAFNEEEALAVVTVPEGLRESLIAGEVVELGLRRDATDESIVAVEQALEGAARQVNQTLGVAHLSLSEAQSIRPFESPEERADYFEQGLEMALVAAEDGGMAVEFTQAAEVNEQIAEGFEQSSPGELVTWVLITLLGASELLVDERLKGTLRRLAITPTSRAQVLTGKIVGQLGTGIVQMVVLIGFGAVAFGVDWGRSYLALAMVVLAFALAAVALGVALGTFVRTRRQASGLTIFFSMLLGALGGAWWPLEITPPSYQAAVRVLPSTWAMLGFQDVILRGQGPHGVLLETGALLAFAAVFFTVGIWRFRYE